MSATQRRRSASQETTLEDILIQILFPPDGNSRHATSIFGAGYKVNQGQLMIYPPGRSAPTNLGT
jgi:hypothetical protein